MKPLVAFNPVKRLLAASIVALLAVAATLSAHALPITNGGFETGDLAGWFTTASFDHLRHEELLRMLGQRIQDGALLGLIRKWLRAGILEEDGKVIDPVLGTPQGGVLTPRT